MASERATRHARRRSLVTRKGRRDRVRAGALVGCGNGARSPATARRAVAPIARAFHPGADLLAAIKTKASDANSPLPIAKRASPFSFFFSRTEQQQRPKKLSWLAAYDCMRYGWQLYTWFFQGCANFTQTA